MRDLNRQWAMEGWTRSRAGVTLETKASTVCNGEA